LSDPRFRINAESVVHETVDGEVIVIDLASGSYYSLSGSGPEVWQMLSDGTSAAEACAALMARFEAEPEAVEAAVTALLSELEENALIVASEEAAVPSMESSGANGARKPFVPPVFERYTDMKDYFLLDPIHEVGPEGWPKPAA
jgi:hypothetical protein